MEKPCDTMLLCARAETHASLLETAAALMELDGIGLDPDQGHVQHLRSMAGAIRAQAALGKLAQSYPGARYLPTGHTKETGRRPPPTEAEYVWH